MVNLKTHAGVILRELNMMYKYEEHFRNVALVTNLISLQDKQSCTEIFEY